MRQLYLNNSGHRWVNVDEIGKRDTLKVWNPTKNKLENKSVKYWEAIGNFSVPYVRGRKDGKEIIVQMRENREREGCWEPNVSEKKD